MPLRDLKARQQRQKYEIRQLTREVATMRQERLAAEAALQAAKQETSAPATQPEAKKSGGGNGLVMAIAHHLQKRYQKTCRRF